MIKRQRPQTMPGLELFHPLPELGPFIRRVVDEGPGLVVVAGLDPRADVAGPSTSAGRVSGAGERPVPSGQSTLFRILIREMLARHPGRAIAVARDRDVVRVPRQLERRVELALLQPDEPYARRISAALRRAPALLAIDRLDAESAPAALEAGRVGLRVLSQIDTVFKGADVARHLVDLGVSREQLTGLAWIVSVQRMATLCPCCRQQVFLDPQSVDTLLRRYPNLGPLVGGAASPEDLFSEQQHDLSASVETFHEAPGCAQCQFTGRKGHVTCFDVFRPEGTYPAFLEQASQFPIEDYILRLALQGHLSAQDVLRYERDQLHRTYNLFASSERALDEVNATLRSKVVELESANRVLQQRTQALVSLYDIGQALITGAGGEPAAELHELALRVCRHTHDLCGADRAILYLVRPGDKVEVLAVSGWDPALVHRLLDARASFPTLGMERESDAEPRRFARLPPGVQREDAGGVPVRAGLCVPLVAQQERVGWMIVHATRGSPFTPGEVALLQTYANQAAVAIQRAGLVESLWLKIEQLEAAQEQLAQRERLVRELELARQVQQSVLPRTFPQVSGYTFAARNEPARQVGGDFYDVIRLDDEHFGLAVADVSDKGMPAAVYMALTRSLLLAEARRDLSPCAVLGHVNRLLLELGAPGGTPAFVSVFYGVVEAATRRLTYTRAGHDRPLLLRGGSVLSLQGEGAVLGILQANQLRLSEEQIVLAPEDRLVLYTDGLTDVVAPDDRMLGLDRFKALLQSYAAVPVDELCGAIFERLDAYRGVAEQYDDMTMLVMQVAQSGDRP